MYCSHYGTVVYCLLGNADVVAILPDNCHPSSCTCHKYIALIDMCHSERSSLQCWRSLSWLSLMHDMHSSHWRNVHSSSQWLRLGWRCTLQHTQALDTPSTKKLVKIILVITLQMSGNFSPSHLDAAINDLYTNLLKRFHCIVTVLLCCFGQVLLTCTVCICSSNMHQSILWQSAILEHNIPIFGINSYS